MNVLSVHIHVLVSHCNQTLIFRYSHTNRVARTVPVHHTDRSATSPRCFLSPCPILTTSSCFQTTSSTQLEPLRQPGWNMTQNVCVSRLGHRLSYRNMFFCWPFVGRRYISTLEIQLSSGVQTETAFDFDSCLDSESDVTCQWPPQRPQRLQASQYSTCAACALHPAGDGLRVCEYATFTHSTTL